MRAVVLRQGRAGGAFDRLRGRFDTASFASLLRERLRSRSSNKAKPVACRSDTPTAPTHETVMRSRPAAATSAQRLTQANRRYVTEYVADARADDRRGHPRLN